MVIANSAASAPEMMVGNSHSHAYERKCQGKIIDCGHQNRPFITTHVPARSYTHCQHSQANWPLTIDTRWMPSRKVLRFTTRCPHTLIYIDSVDRKLFSQITQPRHCLHYLLPLKTSTHCPYSLRKRQRYYQLPVPQVEYTRYKTVLLIFVG